MAADSHKQGPIDIWTPAHVLTGALTRYVGLSPYAAAGLWLGFEVLENTIGEMPIAKQEIPTSGSESVENIIGDICANALGYWLINKMLSK